MTHYPNHVTPPRPTGLAFGAQVPVQCAVLRKAAATFEALEGLLPSVMSYVPHQRAFLPEAPGAELTHVGLLLPVGALVYLEGVLWTNVTEDIFKTQRRDRILLKHCYFQKKRFKRRSTPISEILKGNKHEKHFILWQADHFHHRLRPQGAAHHCSCSNMPDSNRR